MISLNKCYYNFFSENDKISYVLRNKKNIPLLCIKNFSFKFLNNFFAGNSTRTPQNRGYLGTRPLEIKKFSDTNSSLHF